MDAPPPLQDMRSLWAPPYLVSCRYPDKSVAGAIACFIQLFLFYLFTCLSFLSLICMDVYHLADEVFFSLVWNNHVARNSHVYLGRRHALMMRAVAIACLVLNSSMIHYSTYKVPSKIYRRYVLLINLQQPEKLINRLLYTDEMMSLLCTQTTGE